MPRRGRKGKSLREIPRAGGNEARINWAGIMFARQGWHLLGRCLFLPLLGYEGNDGDITASMLREFGGGGGNRTPVRKVSIKGVYMLILYFKSRSSQLPEAGLNLSQFLRISSGPPGTCVPNQLAE